jgi:hypothetical protein
MLFKVSLGGFACVMTSVFVMTASHMCVMGRGFMFARIMMASGFLVMSGRAFMMFRRPGVMLRGFFRHVLSR